MHLPFPHWNSDSEHSLYFPLHISSFSSEESPQSFSKSHNHRLKKIMNLCLNIYICAKNSLGHASVVATLEITLATAGGTVLGQLVRAVPAVVLAVAEQPLWNTAVVGAARAALPASGAVALPALVGGLVRVVTAVVVKVAHPQTRDAAAVLALELGVRVALPVV
jgi:hypothetical protein